MTYAAQTGNHRSETVGVGSPEDLAVLAEVDDAPRATPLGRGRGEHLYADDFYAALLDPTQDAVGVSRGTVRPRSLTGDDPSPRVPTEVEVDETEAVDDSADSADATDEPKAKGKTKDAKSASELKKLSILKLRDLAKERGIDLGGAKKKDEIITKIVDG